MPADTTPDLRITNHCVTISKQTNWSSTGYRNLLARMYPRGLILVVVLVYRSVTALPNNIKIGE